VAQQELLQRYAGAIYRYLLAALNDPDAADEVAQEFAYCLVRGDFAEADPGRGRFRDFLKTVLFHLIVNHQRTRNKQARLLPLPVGEAEPAVVVSPDAESEREFLRLWREELLDHAWGALAEEQGRAGPDGYTVLRLRAEQPGLSSSQMAEHLGPRLGKEVTAVGVRQALHRARRRFAELLVEEVARSLVDATPEQIEQELIDLELLVYCRPALERRVGTGA
jgi:DNA-directed RNA polymerase specialized sigma24 family protein